MKKILLIVGIAVITNFVNAQDDGKDIKNVRFGLNVTPTLDWYKPDGKILTGNGVVPKIGGGLLIEFRLAKVASIATGVQIQTAGGKINYANGDHSAPNSNTVSYYYSNSDDKINKYSDTPGAGTDSASRYNYYQSNTRYQLNSRVYNVTYITIPLTLKLKTKQIGMMTYFGNIGVNNSIRWKATAKDNVTNWNTGSNTTNSKVDITKDVALFHETLTVGVGAEMNLSGTTSIVFGLNYLLGFTNAVKGTSDYLMKQTNNATGSGYSQDGLPQSIKTNSVALTVGILF